MFDPISLYPVAWSSWCIKLTITLIQVSFALSTRNIYLSCCSFLVEWIPPGSSGVSVNYEENLLVHLALQGPEGWNWKGHVLKEFFATWLVLTDASGTIQNSGSLPWVHIGISWELPHSHGSWPGWAGRGLVWGIWKAPQSLRITELRENHSEPLALWARAVKKSVSHLPGTGVCQELRLPSPWLISQAPF